MENEINTDKIFSASSRFKPSETVVFDPPLEGKNGNKLVSYTWSFEWTMLPNYEGELKSKRVSDWTQAEISADTGRDIVHQYAILMPDGEHKVVSSESVPVLLGFYDKKEFSVFPNLVTASKTLAKQQMQLAIMEAQEKEYRELYAKFEKAEKPEIRMARYEELSFAKFHKQEEGVVSSQAYFIMQDVQKGQYNKDYYDPSYGTRFILIDKPNRDTIEQLTSFWISKRVEENGGKYPSGLYDLKNRVARQKNKVEKILSMTKMENGGDIEDMSVKFIDYKGHEIMFEPHYKEYFMNDEQFSTLEDAQKYIDNGMKLSAKTINAYRNGAFEEGGEIEKSDIEQKIEDRIKERQKSKEFKDTSVVGYTRKYSAAYDIITSADLSKIEMDNVTAYKLIEKSKIWIPYNVESLKSEGNSSGAAYLKIKTREALSARPIDTKLGREVYVKNIEKLIGLLEPCKSVSEVQDVLKDFSNLDSFDFIDLSHLKGASYTYTSSVGNLKNHNERDVIKYFEDIFGKRFYQFCRFKSDSSKKIAVEASLYQEFKKEQRDIILNKRIALLSSNIAKIEKILPLISEDTDKNRETINELDENYVGSYGQDYVINYYKIRFDSYKRQLQDVDSGISKIFSVREDDWSWSGVKEKKQKVEVDALDKVAKEPLTIIQQYGIEDWRKSAKRLPLAYIKRTGGLDVNEISVKEIKDKFSFRNVIFGNYVNDKESKEHSRHFIGAMLDLHEIMNLNVKQINEIGGLDINFGSTGCGHFSLAMACYFPEYKAINLTKKTGDGSVAHEWSHYLDNMLGEGNERKATEITYATSGGGVSQKIKYLFSEWNNWLKTGGESRDVEIEYSAQKKYKFRVFGEDLESAIEGVKKRYSKTYDSYDLSSSADAIKYYGWLAHKFNDDKPITVTFKTNATSYYVISSNYGQGYWNSPVELFARAFEWSIEEMLKRKGRVSNYLVDTVNSMGMMGALIPYHLHPYPRVEEEQEWLLDWFDRLFSAIRTEYSVAPFHWDTVERTDEYLEYENKKTDVIADGISVSETTGEAEVVGSDIEYRENGYSFKRNTVNGTFLYTVLVNEKATNYYIGTSIKYGNKSDSGYVKRGWVIVTKQPEEVKYSTINYFKTLKEAQDFLVNTEKLEPIKVELTKEDYVDALNGAEVMLEFVSGKEKEGLIDYIEGLKVMMEFA